MNFQCDSETGCTGAVLSVFQALSLRLADLVRHLPRAPLVLRILTLLRSADGNSSGFRAAWRQNENPVV